MYSATPAQFCNRTEAHCQNKPSTAPSGRQAGRALTAGPLITAIHAVQPAVAAHAFLNAAPGVAGKLARAGWEGREAKQHVSPAAAPPVVIPNALSFLLAAFNVKNSFPSEQRTTRRSAGKQDVLLSPEKHAS